MPEGSTPSSLTVLGGACNGNRLVLEDLRDEVLLGSDPECHLALALPGVSPIHARLWLDDQGVSVHDTHSPFGLYVNDDRVVGQTPLKDGDILWLGPPGGADSVMIQCHLAAARAPARSDVAAEAPPSADEFFVDPSAMEADPVAPAADDAAFILDSPAEPASSAPSPLLDEFVIAEDQPSVAAAAPADDLFVVDEGSSPSAGGGFGLEEPAWAQAGATAAEQPPVVFDEPLPAAPLMMDDEPPFVAAPELPKPPVAPAPAAPTAPVPPRPAPAAKAAPAPAPRPSPPPSPPSPAPAVAKPAAAPRPPRPPSGERAPRPSSRKQDTGLPEIELAPSRASTPPPRAAARRGGAPFGKMAVIGLAVAALLGAAGIFVARFLNTPKVASLAPARARVGEPVTLVGTHFAPDAAGNAVSFGDAPARVLKASAQQIEVEVPELPTVPGRDFKVPVRVVRHGRASEPLEIAVYQAPRVHGLAPDVAMPGEEVLLAGIGFGPRPTVHFAGVAADVVDAAPDSIKVKVPALEAAEGTTIPVVVNAGPDGSNPAPFTVGRLPLVMKVEPHAAAPGDLVRVTGRGFKRSADAADVRVGGTRALVVTATDGDVTFVVPRGLSGEVPVELRVAGLEPVGHGTVTLPAPPENIELRFVAEPWGDGRARVAVSTDLGPAFLLAEAGGRSAPERAAEAARKLNEAVAALRAGADFELRGMPANPVLGVAGKPDGLLLVTEEDAAAYAAGARGPAVTRPRLALWWSAVARDLVKLLVRGEKPEAAAALAAEGRVLGDLYQAARKSGKTGFPREVLAQAKPAQREAAKALATRVPSSVPGPTVEVAAIPQVPPVQLDGAWSGWETEHGLRKSISLNVRGAGGTFNYEGGLTVSLPLLRAEQQPKGVLRFAIQVRSGVRYYVGKWDGQKAAGKISTQPDGKDEIGAFEIHPGR